jgi:hypothetical protein
MTHTQPNHPLDRLTQPETNLDGLLQNAIAVIEHGRPSRCMWRLYYIQHWVELAYWLNFQRQQLADENARLRAELDRQPMAWPVASAR